VGLSRYSTACSARSRGACLSALRAREIKGGPSWNHTQWVGGGGWGVRCVCVCVCVWGGGRGECQQRAVDTLQLLSARHGQPSAVCRFPNKGVVNCVCELAERSC
jgi:hypothetical protein